MAVDYTSGQHIAGDTRNVPLPDGGGTVVPTGTGGSPSMPANTVPAPDSLADSLIYGNDPNLLDINAPTAAPPAPAPQAQVQMVQPQAVPQVGYDESAALRYASSAQQDYIRRLEGQLKAIEPFEHALRIDPSAKDRVVQALFGGPSPSHPPAAAPESNQAAAGGPPPQQAAAQQQQQAPPAIPPQLLAYLAVDSQQKQQLAVELADIKLAKQIEGMQARYGADFNPLEVAKVADYYKNPDMEWAYQMHLGQRAYQQKYFAPQQPVQPQVQAPQQYAYAAAQAPGYPQSYQAPIQDPGYAAVQQAYYGAPPPASADNVLAPRGRAASAPAGEPYIIPTRSWNEALSVALNLANR